MALLLLAAPFVVQAIGHVDHGHRSAEVALAVIEFHAHFMQGAHIFPDNWLCTPFVSNSDHRSLKNRILATGKKYFLMTEKFLLHYLHRSARILLDL